MKFETSFYQMFLPSNTFLAQPNLFSSQLSFFTLESRILQAALPCGAFLAITFLSVYIATWLSFMYRRQSQDPVKVPPTVPYMIPFVGSAISLALNPARCLLATSRLVGPQAVHGIKILNTTLYFVYKPENIAKIWKYPTTITTPEVTVFILKTLLGMAPKAFDMYTIDTSGIYPKPSPGSHVAPHNRIDYLTYTSFHKHLFGEGLSNFYLTFAAALMHRFKSLNIENDWIELPDIMEFWLPPLTTSLNETIVGPILECLNPNFTRDLLKYFWYVHPLMKGLPRWCIPEAYRLRETLVQSMKQWRAIAMARFKETDIDEDGGTDPWWGSALMRERQKFLAKVDNWDDDSIASSDLGVLWGASVNIHPMAIWNIIEVFRDRSLLSRVRAELATVHFQGITSREDIDKLLSLPLLQSIYAEMLRLRVETQTVLSSDREDIRINEWQFPKKTLILVPCGAAHRDLSFWNTKEGEHPVDQFWADRFLIYPDDRRSGPRKNGTADLDKFGEKATEAAADPGKPKFVNSGLANSFIPYGIGERTCPGRGFARREIIAFCAIMVHQFDLEILSTEKDFKISPAFYGLGTQRPLRKIPFKVRKRRVE
ncbi:hypothetical protein MMC22_009940 [Lobaria immixta]|nr:hypothetical protein [Lobaria immixta]